MTLNSCSVRVHSFHSFIPLFYFHRKHPSVSEAETYREGVVSSPSHRTFSRRKKVWLHWSHGILGVNSVVYTRETALLISPRTFPPHRRIFLFSSSRSEKGRSFLRVGVFFPVSRSLSFARPCIDFLRESVSVIGIQSVCSHFIPAINESYRIPVKFWERNSFRYCLLWFYAFRSFDFENKILSSVYRKKVRFRSLKKVTILKHLWLLIFVGSPKLVSLKCNDLEFVSFFLNESAICVKCIS